MSQIIPLSLMRTGDAGQICDLQGEHDFIARLEEMGLREGVVIRMLQPGTPCIVGLGEQRLSFRGSEILELMVELVEPEQAALTAGAGRATR